MANGLVNMSSQFKGLPMSDLIGGPLSAACTAQIDLANATANFIQTVGFLPKVESDKIVPGDTRTVNFSFKRPYEDPESAGSFKEEEVKLEAPMLAIVKVPNLSIKTVDVTFDMEVKSSTSTTESSEKSGSVEAQAKVGWGPFSASVKIKGSVSSHKENTRKSDNSAKYHVEIHAEDSGPPEGLMRVLDVLQTACVPQPQLPEQTEQSKKQQTKK